MLFNNRDCDTRQRFSIRKLTIGVCSVLLATLFLTMSNNQVVHASTDSSTTTTQTSQTDTNSAKDKLNQQRVTTQNTQNTNSKLTTSTDGSTTPTTGGSASSVSKKNSSDETEQAAQNNNDKQQKLQASKATQENVKQAATIKSPTNVTSTTETPSDSATTKKINSLLNILVEKNTKMITADDIPAGAINEDGSAVTSSDFSKTVTRTVTFDYADKTPTTTVQSTTLTRTGNYDLVTKKVTWGDYSTGSFARINTPSDGNYTPSMRYIQPVSDVTADFVDPQIVVTYAVATQRFVRFQTVDDDENEAAVADTTVQSYYGAIININDLSSTKGKLLIPSGYELASGQSATYTVPNKNMFGANTVKIHLIHKPVVGVKKSVQYTFVDDDNNDSQVGDTTTVTSDEYTTVNTGLSLPTNYELASGQTLPTTVRIKNNNANVTIHLVHKKAQVSSTSDWSTYGVASADQVALTKDVTRTISINNPDDSSVTVDGTTQIVSFKRTAIVDEVTKKVVGYVDPSDSTKTVTDGDSAWKQTSTSDQWDAYTPTLPSGYAIWRVNNDSTSGSTYTNVTTAQSGEITGLAAQTGITASTADQNVVIVITNLWYRVQEVDDDDNGTVIGTGYITRDGLNTNITMHFNDGITIANYEGVSVGDTTTGTEMPTGFTMSYDGTDDGTLASPKGQYKVNGSYGTFAQASAAGVFGKTYTIHVKHKTEDVSSTDANAKTTRVLTLNYVDASTGEAMSGLESAVMDVYYKRTATKDLVTGKVTYGGWFWDTSQGDSATPGYHVVKGTWTTPESWANPTVTVPTVSGYTAITTGDWEKVGDNTSTVPANEFVYPTWNNTDSNTTINNNPSLAYTSDATVYEATATHTVYFVPDKTASQTITVNYKYWENGQVGDDVYSPAKLEVYYRAKGTGYSVTSGSIYSDYTIDTTKGDTATPGYHVISVPDGTSWDNVIKATNENIVPEPTKDNYRMVTFYSNNNRADQITIPTTVSSTTGAFEDVSRTLFYIPESDVDKYVTRTINVTDPTTGTVTQTIQRVLFARRAILNDADDGVIFGIYKNQDRSDFVAGDDLWETQISHTSPIIGVNKTGTVAGNPKGAWAALDVTKDGYTAIIDGQAVTEVAKVKGVAYNAADQTVNVTYIKNTANITISGNDTKTFDNTAATIPSDITNTVTAGDSRITLPTGSDSVSLNSDDFSWTDTDGNAIDAPTSVGTYHIVLNDTGLKKFKDLDSNFTWNYDPKTSYATYTIKAASATAALSGSASKTYDGKATSLSEVNGGTIAVTLNFPGATDSNKTYTLQTGDYTWNTSDGSAPTTVGDYTITLTDTGKTHLQAAIDAAVGSGNVTLASSDATGSADFKINQATATVTFSNGTQSVNYNGTADQFDTSKFTPTISTDNGVTLNVPATANLSIADGDFSFTKDGTTTTTEPTELGTYTVKLTDRDLAKLESDTINYKWVNKTSGTYTINKADDTTVTLSNVNGGQSETYKDAAYTNSDINVADYSVTLGNGKTYTLVSGDLEFVPSADPTNAGTYEVELSEQGKTNIAKVDSTHYSYTFDGADTGKFTITKAKPTVSFSGDAEKTYDGTAISNYAPTLTITAPGNLTTTLTAGTDYVWVDSTGTQLTTAPSAVGTYTVKLTSTGLNKITALNSDNLDWSALTVDNAGTGTYKIDQASATGTLAGSGERNYNGSAVTSAELTSDGNIAVTLTIPAGENSTAQTLTYDLQDGDYNWYNGDTKLTTAPKDAGTYTIKLNSSALAKIQAAINNDATWKGNVTVSADDLSGAATFTINQLKASISLSGEDSSTYNSQAVSVPLDKVKDALSASGLLSDESLDLSGLTAAGFDWYNGTTKLTVAPTNAGTYTLQLNDTGLSELEAKNKNYTFTTGSANSFTYTINKANATISLNETDNNQTATWDGSTISLDLNKFKPTITTDNSNQSTISLPSTLTLNATDYVITQNGATATPKEPGTYSVSLTTAGWQKVRDAITGNANYNWTTTGNGKLTINKASATITLSGSGSVTYTGNVATIPTSSYSVTLSNGQTYTLQPGDLEFASTGNINVGDYTVKLSAAGLTNIEKVDADHYTYTYDDGTAKLTIAPAAATATITGSDSKVYDGTAATLDGSKYSVTLSNGQTYTLKNGDYAFANTDGTIISAPTDHGSYKVVLTDQGKTNIENLTKAGTIQNYTWTFDSSATYDITAQKMAIVVSGEASKVYDGANATITDADLAHITLKWGNNTSAPSGITYTLSADDLEVVDASGNPVSAANYRNGAATGTKYYIVLKDNALTKIQAQNKNYEFSLAATTSSPTTSDALYTIYARKAALTLSGSQTVNYGDLTALDLSKFTVDFSNWTSTTEAKPTVTLQSGDLQIVIPTGTTTENNVPVDVGQYTVKMTEQLINRLKDQYTNYDFDEEASTTDSQGNVQEGTGQDATHNPALYIVQAKQIEVTLSGKQTIKYGEANTIDPSNYQISFSNIASRDQSTFDGFKLKASDLTFVTTPGDVGSYQVKLSDSGIARLKALGTNFATNYDWSENVDNARADFEVVKMPVTITVRDNSTTQHQTITYGQTPNIDNSNYQINLKTEDGTTLAYTPVEGDLTFKDGTPSNAGTYDVILSAQGLQNIETKYGTKNYSYTSTGNGEFEIQKAKGTITLADNGTPGKTFDNTAASLSSGDYKLTISTDNGPVTYNLSADDLNFVDASGATIAAPTAAGTYAVQLKPNVIAAIESQVDSTGKNYSWTTSQTADYTISKAAASASLSGQNHQDYNGSAVTTTEVNSNGDIKVTISVAGLDHTVSYTLTDGDYDWYNGSTKLDSAPTNAGTYTIKLSDSALAKLQNAIANDSTFKGNVTLAQNAVSGSAIYTINKIGIAISMGDDNQQTEVFDNDTIALDPSDFIPTLNAGSVNVPTIPTSGENALTANDFTITDQDGHVVTNPTNAGTYNVTLNSQGLAKLAKLSSNFTWPTTVSGHGTLIIKAATANASLSGSNQKVYDGTAVTTAEVNAGGNITVKVAYSNTPATSFPFMTLAYVNGDSILTYTLQDGDYTWNTSDHSAPTNVGTYHISLTKQGMQNIQKAINEKVGKGNVALTDESAGTAEYDITPFKINITVDGSTTVPSGTTTIPDNTYSLDYSSGETGLDLPTGLVQPTGKLDASQLEFIGAAPTKDTAGQSFIIGYKGGQTALQELLGSNYQVEYAVPAANYHVTKASSQTVEYVDGNGEIIKTLDPIIGDKGTEVAFDNAANMPDNWVLVDGEKAPTSITISGGITQIKIKHGTKEITIHDNNDWPRNVDKYDFQREITRTINVTDPSGHTTTTKQTVQFTRTGIKDLVTNLVTWNAWKPTTGTWAEFDTPTIAGYTPSQSKVDAQTVTADTKDATVNITYTPYSVGPDNPDNPSQPTGATKPTAPTKPVNPTKPNKPHKPGKPTKPNKPHKPGKPQKPAQPKQPNVPASKPNNSNNNFGPKYAEHRQNYQTKGESLHRVHRLADGTIVGPKGEAYAGSAAKTANGKKTLPQTGEKNNKVGILGSLLASLGLFGLAGTRKRRKKDQ